MAPLATDVGTDERIRSLLDGAADLPVLPDVAARVLNELRSPRVTASRLAEFVQKDPVLASSILRVANSALYGGRVEITDLSFAMVRIGLNQARNLVLANVLRSKLVDREVYGSVGPLLMDHALAVAFASQLIEESAHRPWEEAFLCGLLHDFGFIALIKVLREAKGTNQNDAESLLAAADRHHTVAGAMLAHRWGLPEVVAVVARYHHEPFVVEGPARRVTAVVALADRIAHDLGLGHCPEEHTGDVVSAEARELVGISEMALSDIKVRLPGLFATARSAVAS
ncbi:MAG: HDOD domain-containing protein [Acidobacteria bacterium]|nr:HDOD domain-containing protein [Acidobacteriota bacterium]